MTAENGAMDVTVEKISNLGRKLKIQIPQQRLYAEYNTKLDKLTNTMQVHGFRQGRKLPASTLKQKRTVISQKYGKQLRHEVVNEMMELCLRDALKQTELVPAEQPLIESHSEGIDSDLEYTVKFEVFPKFDIDVLPSIELEKEIFDIHSDDIEAFKTKIADNDAAWKKVDRQAKDDDKVMIDFESFINGQEYKNSSGRELLVHIGSKNFIEGFEDALIGVSAGDAKEFELSYPEDWPDSDIAGKLAKFKVQVEDVQEKEPLAFDADFAKKIGVEDGDVEQIDTKVKELLQQQLDSYSKKKLHDDALEKLVATVDVDLPKNLVLKEKANLVSQSRQGVQQSKSLTNEHDEFEKQAEKRVALGLIMNKIIEQESIKADSNKIKDKIADLAKYFGNKEVIEQMYSDSESLLQEIEHAVLMEQVVEFVLSQSKINEVKKPVQDVIK